MKKEKLLTYELNAIYTPGDNVRIQLNGFHNELRDVILLSNLSAFEPNKNPGIFKITGVEAVLDFDITKNISGFANFTWQHTRGKNLVTGNARSLSGVADVKGNAGITTHINNLFVFNLSGIGLVCAEHLTPTRMVL